MIALTNADLRTATGWDLRITTSTPPWKRKKGKMVARLIVLISQLAPDLAAHLTGMAVDMTLFVDDRELLRFSPGGKLLSLNQLDVLPPSAKDWHTYERLVAQAHAEVTAEISEAMSLEA